MRLSFFIEESRFKKAGNQSTTFVSEVPNILKVSLFKPLSLGASCFTFLLILLIFSAGISMAATAASSVGRQHGSPVEVYLERTQGGNSQFYIPESANLLVGTLGDQNWEVLSYDRPELVSALRHNAPDFIFTNSDLGAVLQRYLHYRHLLSFKNRVSTDAGKLSGSLIVISKNSDIQNLDEIAGKKIGRLATSSMAGWKTAVGEATARGFKTQEFFRRIQSFPDNEEMINALIKGDISAAILQGCHYERLPEGLREQLKPLEPREFMETRCLSTSELYPAWSLLVTPNVSEQMQQKVLAALKNERSLSEFGEWTDPAPLRDVYALLKRSDDELIDEFEPETWTDLVWKVRYPALFVLLVLFGLLIHDRLVVKEVAKQTALVKESLRKQWTIEKKMEAWERASIVSIMSSMVAHELKQPLTVIENYTQSLISRQKQGSGVISEEMLSFVLPKIEKSVLKAIDIIDHVQGFSKNRPLVLRPTDISKLLSKVTADFQAKNPEIKLQKNFVQGLVIDGDEFELSIAFLNILKNAAQAMKGQEAPEIEVSSAPAKEEGFVRVSITDNGPGLKPEEIENLRNPLQTSKADGLGLGLSIVRAIAERHRGSVRIEAGQTKGMSIVLLLGRHIECEELSSKEEKSEN